MPQLKDITGSRPFLRLLATDVQADHPHQFKGVAFLDNSRPPYVAHI